MAWKKVDNKGELSKLNDGLSPNNHAGQNLGDADEATPVDDDWRESAVRNTYQIRTRKFKEITNDLKYTGRGTVTNLAQNWDRCPRTLKPKPQSPGTSVPIM